MGPKVLKALEGGKLVKALEGPKVLKALEGPKVGPGRASKEVNHKVQALEPSEIRFSQSTVSSSKTRVDSSTGKKTSYSFNDIAAGMTKNGWKGAPINIVRMPDGGLTSIDNTRLLAARKAGIKAEVVIHEYNAKIPSGLAEGYKAEGKDRPKTWGEAISARIQSQKDKYYQDRIFSEKFKNGSIYDPELVDRSGGNKKGKKVQSEKTSATPQFDSKKSSGQYDYAEQLKDDPIYMEKKDYSIKYKKQKDLHGHSEMSDKMKKQEAEINAGEYFAKNGKEVKFLKESTVDGERTADLVIGGVEYDVKAPTVAKESKIKRMIEDSVKGEQAGRFIVDLTYTKVKVEKIENMLSRIKGNAKNDARLDKLKEIVFMKDGQIVSHQVDKNVKKSILDI